MPEMWTNYPHKPLDGQSRRGFFLNQWLHKTNNHKINIPVASSLYTTFTFWVKYEIKIINIFSDLKINYHLI